MTAEQWSLFASRLDHAESYVQDSDPQADPHVYYLRMGIAKGRPDGRPALDAFYSAAVRLHPTYFHYYSQRADVLQERWHGRQGELQRYVASVLRSPGGEEGQVAYAYIAFDLMRSNARETLYQTTGLAWPLVQAAYAMRERRYGLRNRDWNALCNLAIAASDRAAAKEALDKIGADWDPVVWKERTYFDAAVAWIMNTPSKAFQPTVPTGGHGG